MEQIYYTQCPVGYGLGASNGFQVKRLTKGYPVSGDFRHLGLKAFPGGGRTLAPSALRYRRDGEVAEVAWLTPRANEYETERGLWGRPGGHFAHGLRLGPDELKAIRRWPAGLFESPIWKRTDREPSRGRPPDEVDLSAEGLFVPPNFAEVAALANDLDPDRLARLLTALAIVTREGRTLFVVDEPDRLGRLVALLTFAFPEKFREELTFSTYHDRPEELPGFRISGTIPLARPNKPALTAQGIVADLVLGTFEPRIEPATWAMTLAGWLTRHDPVDEADWSSTEGRSRAARRPKPPDSVWSDAWLGHLYRYPEAQRLKASPEDPIGWKSLGEFTTWLGRSGLAEEWVRPRNPAWWLEAAGSARQIPEARAALMAHACLRDTWRGEPVPSSWGDVVASWFRDAEASERDASIAAILQAAPRSSRPAFARALLRGLTPEGASAVLDRLRDDPASDRGMLLPLEASAAVAAILEGANLDALKAVVEEALSLPGASAAVLDAVEAGVVDRPEAVPNLALAVAASFDPEGPGEGREGLSWALRRGSVGREWLGPALRPILADVGRQDLWMALRDRTPEDLRPALVRAVLAIADDDRMPEEAYRWGVEGLLLPLAPRPTEPSWAETYLKRIPSGLDLLRRLVAPEYRKLGLLAWLNQARGREEISAEQASRIDSCLDYARALNSRDPNSLLKIHVPSVPPEERGVLLGQMLAHVGGASLEGLPFVLEACQHAWPGAFQAGSPGLRSLAVPLARCLSGLALPPAPWLARLTQILEKLGLAEGERRGFEPDGLAAEVAASAPRIAGGTVDPWPLRKYLFDHDSAWRILAVDIRRDLDESKAETSADVLARWDKPINRKPDRFFELFLNACDPRQLAAVVSNRAADLKTLPPLPWWDHARHPEARNDLREGFCRITPIAPFERGQLFLVRQWVEGPTRRPSGSNDVETRVLSAQGVARWKCLEALNNFQNVSEQAEVRWPVVTAWEANLPLGAISPDDRYRFVAWLVLGLDSAEDHQLDQLAAWLKKVGLRDPIRLDRWAEEIEPLVEVAGTVRLQRGGLIRGLRAKLYGLLRDDPELNQTRKTAPPRI